MRLVEEEAVVQKWNDTLRPLLGKEEFDSTFKEFLKDYFKDTIDTESPLEFSLLKKWFDAYGSINNPLFNYIATVNNKMNTQKLSYEDLFIFNNAYARRQILENDINKYQTDGVMELLLNPKYYLGDQESKEFWLEIFQYLSRQKNVDNVFAGLPDDLGITVVDNNLPVSTWKKLPKLRNKVIFGKDSSKGDIRNAYDIEKSLRDLANIEGRTKSTTQQQNNNTRRDANRELRNNQSIERWIRDNNLTSDTLTALRDFLNSVDVNAI